MMQFSRKIYLFTVVLCLSLFASAKDAGRDFGLGVVVGGPTAITAKYWLDQERALDGGIAFSVNNYILLYGDYLWHYPRPFKQTDPFFTELDFYLGIGANLAITTSDRSNNNNYLGRRSGSVGLSARVPVGLEWKPADPPLGVFVEIVPGISVIPETSVIIQGGIGIRYYFN